MKRAACVLWDKMSNNIKPAQVQVQCLQIESHLVFYMIFDISVERPRVLYSSLPLQHDHDVLGCGHGPHHLRDLLEEGGVHCLTDWL